MRIEIAPPWVEIEAIDLKGPRVQENLPGRYFQVPRIRQLLDASALKTLGEFLAATTTMVPSFAEENSEGSPQSLPAEWSFEVQSEVVRICGFGEDVTLEKTEGVQRLIAVVTSPKRRLAVMELARIGAVQQASDRGLIDRDDDGLTERESVNDERLESALGADAIQAARDVVGDLIAERDAASEEGDEDKAERLTQQINASLIRPKTDRQKAARNIQKTLDRTYDRLRDKDKGTKLAKHFDDYIKRPRKSSDFIYDPDESERKIVWNLK